MIKKVALITGIYGQDGAYLARFLLNKNYKVIGIERRSTKSNNWRLERLNIKDKIIIEGANIKEINSLIKIFDKYRVDEVYNLAAKSFVYRSFQDPIETSLVNSIGVLNLLEIIRKKKIKLSFIKHQHQKCLVKVVISIKTKKLYFIQVVHMQFQRLFPIIL